MYSAIIIDGYVDEPSCLGVPPFISPYVRYIYGLLKTSNKIGKIKYITIDELRKVAEYNKTLLVEYNLVIVFTGLVVPGKYLNAKPITLKELKSFKKTSGRQIFILCGPIWLGYQYSGGKQAIKYELSEFDFIIKGYAEAGIKDFLETGKIKDKIYERDYEDIARFSLSGAKLVTEHYLYPYVICEIETAQGCPRKENCSFCIEGLFKRVMYRAEDDIINEINELYKNGIRYFRIGNQTDIFSYKFSEEPASEKLEYIFKKIWQKSPDIKVLHTDNANPSVIANYKKSIDIIKILVNYTTSGNSLPLGLETADKEVIRLNNLNSNVNDTFKSIELINKYGNYRGENGMPQLLPAVNFIYGLLGENRETWEKNYLLLQRILESGLLLRRINLRQVMIFPQTKISKYINIKKIKKFKNNFLYWKEKIREEIDRPMLKKVVPLNTVLKEVKIECYENNLSFGRQLGSYPLLIGIKEKLEINKFYDVKIIDYGYRSITGEVCK